MRALLLCILLNVSPTFAETEKTYYNYCHAGCFRISTSEQCQEAITQLNIDVVLQSRLASDELLKLPTRCQAVFHFHEDLSKSHKPEVYFNSYDIKDTQSKDQFCTSDKCRQHKKHTQKTWKKHPVYEEICSCPNEEPLHYEEMGATCEEYACDAVQTEFECYLASQHISRVDQTGIQNAVYRPKNLRSYPTGCFTYKAEGVDAVSYNKVMIGEEVRMTKLQQKEFNFICNCPAFSDLAKEIPKWEPELPTPPPGFWTWFIMQYEDKRLSVEEDFVKWVAASLIKKSDTTIGEEMANYGAGKN